MEDLVGCSKEDIQAGMISLPFMSRDFISLKNFLSFRNEIFCFKSGGTYLKSQMAIL
jgi:hypothetical protein